MATLAARPSRLEGRSGPGTFALLTRRALHAARVRTIGFVYVFAAVSYIQPVAYRHTYPTLEDRIRFARSFAENKAVVLFYGKAYNLLTVGGYSAWRVGGTLSVFAAVFGLLAAVRGFRGEEDAGRAELVLAGPVARSTAYLATITAITLSVLLLGIAELAGLVGGGLPAGGSAFLALAVISVAPVFAGVGALASQLASTRRQALELGGAMVALSFLLRVVADTSTGAGWVRWLTPLGWTEEMRPFTGTRPLVLLLPLAVSLLLLGISLRVARRRDVGLGLLAAHDSSRSHLRLLSSPTAYALRAERLGLLVWATAVGALGFVIGTVSPSVNNLGISKQLQHALSKLGVGSALTPRAYIGFSFSFFAVVLSALAVSQIGAAWHEEAEGRLETVLGEPLGRRRWLTGRLCLGAGAVVLVALSAAVFTWAGAVSQDVSLSLTRMLVAGLNLVPVALVFLGIAALAYAMAPRAAMAIAYGLLTLSYLWQLFGKLLGAPSWLLNATPFAHVALAPAQPVRWGAAAALLGVAAVASAAAVGWFRRRDIVGA
ncbi:MAG TPA: hypothetical protein VKR21_00630 [Solirubrobacteraceae bacterium]|nr:hypothetical protein [Solirubrobacteraceae bacterium]